MSLPRDRLPRPCYTVSAGSPAPSTREGQASTISRWACFCWRSWRSRALRRRREMALACVLMSLRVRVMVMSFVWGVHEIKGEGHHARCGSKIVTRFWVPAYGGRENPLVQQRELLHVDPPGERQLAFHLAPRRAGGTRPGGLPSRRKGEQDSPRRRTARKEL